MNTSNSFEEKAGKLSYCIESLADMGETISGVRSIEKAAEEILRIVLGTVGASSGTILTLENSVFAVTAGRGTETGKSYPVSEDVLSQLATVEKRLLHRWEPDFPEQLKIFCDKYFSGFEVVLAGVLRAQKKLVGLLLLSKRFMNQDYSEDDLHMLDMICRHVSVAIYNFDLRKRTSAANFRLSHKVLQLESLHDIGLSVAAFKPRRETLQEVLYGSISLLDARKAFFLENHGDRLELGSSVGVDAERLSAFIHHPAFSKKLLTGTPLKLRSSRIARKFFGSETLLAVPVRTSNKLFGTLAVIGKETVDERPVFSSDDKKLLDAFATQAAVALENSEMQDALIEQERLKSELETAAAIHRLIVPAPEDLPSIAGYNIYGHNYPCKEVGGDYFDIIPLSDERFAFVICDVSGKGLSAAMLVSTLQATFHSLLQSSLPLVEIANRANKILYRNTTLDKYSTGFIGIIDIRDGNLETVNAGHYAPLLLRTSGEVEKLIEGGLGFGMFDFATYDSQRSRLSPGDTIYLYTDGISEAFSPEGEEFGTERLEDLVRLRAGIAPDELVLEIEQVIRDWTGQYAPGEGFAHDDFTQLAIRME